MAPATEFIVIEFEVTDPVVAVIPVKESPASGSFNPVIVTVPFTKL